MPFHQKANEHCANRALEWIVGLATALMGGAVLIYFGVMHMIGHTPHGLGAFGAFERYGFNNIAVAVLLIGFAWLRFTALQNNGNWHYGPLIRFGCACFGIFIWANLLFGIIEFILRTEDLAISIGIWIAFMVGEIHTAGRAVLDFKPISKDDVPDAITGT